VKLRSKLIIFWFLTALLTSCTTRAPVPTSSAATDDPTTHEHDQYQPGKGQPTFPALGTYWIIDNGCGFDKETVIWADKVLEKLKQDGIAEIAIVCQTGIQNQGPYNDEKIWILDWARWAGIGNTKDNRGTVWLIRPDVKPEESRVSVTNSDWLTWYTAIDYNDLLKMSANYANYDNFDGTLETIVSGVDSKLRELWLTHSSK